MVACLSHLLQIIYHEQGAHHGIGRVLMIRNQLARQQRKGSAGLDAEKPGNRYFLLFIRKKLNGIAIIFLDRPAAIFSLANQAFLANIFLKAYVEKISFIFPDVRICVIEKVLDI